jgi:PAS domain S-box-containing protein
MLSSVSIIAVVFAAWELVENRFFRELDYVTLHYLYITRGMASSLLLAVWAAWYVLHQRRRAEAELRRSWEHSRRLLEASPGALALYDGALFVSEWNAAAERLYGFSKAHVLGRRLPTVPPGEDEGLRELLRRVSAGGAVVEAETRRLDATGACLEVQLSLLPFRDGPGPEFFLEVTSDIRERVRLRETLIEVEKLSGMAKLAAGTAHHLNTPLAALLLRVQMMRDRSEEARGTSDLAQLEAGLVFCQQFVRRLQDLTRRPPAEKQPVEVARTVASVVTFLSPPILARRARVELSLEGAGGAQVLADRNLLEALFSILLSNALDAIPEGGAITVRGSRPAAERVAIEVADEGCGIEPVDLARAFEPFFTTKQPGKGTGLGLAIARNIVHEHGGTIRLESAPGRGTTACVELPLWRPQPAAADSP